MSGSRESPCIIIITSFAGIQADQRALRAMISNFLPEVDMTLKEHDIELSLITLHWFLTLFASVVHMKILLRIWDLFFFDGSIVLFQVTLGMLKIKGTFSISIFFIVSYCVPFVQDSLICSVPLCVHKM
jgi:hypothetical protein